MKAARWKKEATVATSDQNDNNENDESKRGQRLALINGGIDKF